FAFGDPRRLRGGTALVTAVFAFHRSRDVDPTQLLDGVVYDAVTKELVPGIGERPECSRGVGAHRGALRTRRPLPSALLHHAHHGVIHLLECKIGNPLWTLRHTLPLHSSDEKLRPSLVSRPTPTSKYLWA